MKPEVCFLKNSKNANYQKPERKKGDIINYPREIKICKGLLWVTLYQQII